MFRIMLAEEHPARTSRVAAEPHSEVRLENMAE